jgi:hypothetical protein
MSRLVYRLYPPRAVPASRKAHTQRSLVRLLWATCVPFDFSLRRRGRRQMRPSQTAIRTGCQSGVGITATGVNLWVAPSAQQVRQPARLFRSCTTRRPVLEAPTACRPRMVAGNRLHSMSTIAENGWARPKQLSFRSRFPHVPPDVDIKPLVANGHDASAPAVHNNSTRELQPRFVRNPSRPRHAEPGFAGD